MKSIPFLIGTTMLCAFAYGQNFPAWVVRVGQNPRSAVPDSIEYRFKEFSDGYIITPEDKRSKTMKVNYSHLHAAPMMIGPAGDTLFINHDIIKEFWVRDVSYIKDDDRHYYELLTLEGPVRLAKQEYLRVFRVEDVDVHGLAVTSRAAQNPKAGIVGPTFGTPLNNGVVNQQRTLKMEHDYFFLTSAGKFEKASKKTVGRIFRENKEQVESFIEKNNIDFDSEKDLKDLIAYCANL